MSTIIELEKKPLVALSGGENEYRRQAMLQRVTQDRQQPVHLYDSAPDVVWHHGLYDYLALCWRNHYGVVITPDMIWYSILAEMAAVIKKQPDTWAHLFTTKPGAKQHIIVMTGKVEEIDPVAVVALLEDKVPVQTSTFLPRFTTTTDNSHLARCIAFCDLVSPYYSYGTMLCGIPAIRIEGTLDDWSQILFCLDQLKRLSVTRPMSEYIDRCALHVVNFQEAVDGNTKIGEWDSFLKVRKCGSGSQYEMDGWITRFIYKRSPWTQFEGLPPQMCSMAYINHDTNRRFKLFTGLIQSRFEGDYLVPDFGFARIEETDRKAPYLENKEPDSVEQPTIVMKSTPLVAGTQKLEAHWTMEEKPAVALHSPEVEELLKQQLK